MKTIGILGAGQLGRMLAIAGLPLGLRCYFYDPVANSPASQLAEQKIADFADLAALNFFASGVDLITYEFENVPVEAVRSIDQRVAVYPPSLALEKAQDRLVEKTYFQQLKIPTPKFVMVNSIKQLADGIDIVGLPAVLKTRRLGYDGKGQVTINHGAELEAAWNLLKGTPLILEQYIAFERELSILAVRSINGETAVYPLVENHHRSGILRLSLAPAAGLPGYLQAAAEEYAKRILNDMQYVGVLAIEFFQAAGVLLANEMAPRVHNSGHWTIEGAVTSQFENHMRAVTGSPLGVTSLNGYCAMINLVGTVPAPDRLLAIPGAHLHLYGKEPRPNRKLGHITVVEADHNRLLEKVSQLGDALISHPDQDGGWSPIAKELLKHG